MIISNTTKIQKTTNKSKGAVKTVVRIALLTLVALIVGVNVYTINASRLAGNNIPMPFGVGAAVVLSGSMEKELSAGDLLFVVERDSYEIGDVVVYQDGSMTVTHRIVRFTETGVITRGDANNTDDAEITIAQIKGEVVFAIPLVGFAVNIIKTPVCTLLIIVIAVWLLERSYSTEKERDRQKLNEIKAQIEELKREQENNTAGGTH